MAKGFAVVSRESGVRRFVLVVLELGHELVHLHLGGAGQGVYAAGQCLDGLVYKGFA